MGNPPDRETIKKELDELSKKLKDKYGIDANIMEIKEGDVHLKVFRLLPELEVYSILLKKSADNALFGGLANIIVHSIAMLKMISERVFVSQDVSLFDAYISSLKIVAEKFGDNLEERVKQNESMVTAFKLRGEKDD